jgi:hypothetical protein
MFFGILEIDGASRTHLGAKTAFARFLQINTLIRIDLVFEGHRLGIFDEDRFSLFGGGVVVIIDFFGTFCRAFTAGNTFTHVHITGMFLYRYGKVAFAAADLGDLA